MVEVLRAVAEEAGSLNSIKPIQIANLGIMTDGIQQLINRRLAHMPIRFQPILKLAAVSGQQIDLAIMAQLSLNGLDSDEWLLAGNSAAILEYRHEHWQFTHDKLREAILNRLTHTEEQSLNRQVAEAIEQIYGNSPHYYRILLKHWQKAKNMAKEEHYLPLVADYLIDFTSEYEAANFLLATRLQRLHDDDVRRIPLLHRQAEAYLGLGDPRQAQTLAESAGKLAAQSDSQEALARSYFLSG